MQSTLELEVDTGPLTGDRFWKLADDLLYTRVYYDNATKGYLTRQCRRGSKQDRAVVARTLRDFGCAEAGDGVDMADPAGSATIVLSDDDAELGECTEQDINTLLVSYLAIVSKYAPELATDPTFYPAVARYLCDYPYYQAHCDFCVRKMLSLVSFGARSNLHNLGLDVDRLSSETRAEVNEAIALNNCYIVAIGHVLSEHCSRDPQGIEVLRSGFEALWLALENYAAITAAVQKASEGSTEGGGLAPPQPSDPFGTNYSTYLRLAYKVCGDTQLTREDLSCVDKETLYGLLRSLRLASEMDDPPNHARFKLLLALNEQFIGCYGTAQLSSNTLFAATLSPSRFESFFQVLLYNLNRVADQTIQILIMKFLYLVFLHEKARQLVYLNDAKVIVDIFIRELWDLSPTRHEHLLNVFIRVIHQMLACTQLRRVLYKRGELRKVLEYLANAEQALPKTRLLAQRCLEGDFFSLRELASNMAQVKRVAHDVLAPPAPLLPLSQATLSCPDLTHERPTPPPPPPPRCGSRASLRRTSTNSSQSSLGPLGAPSQSQTPPPPPKSRR